MKKYKTIKKMFAAALFAGLGGILIPFNSYADSVEENWMVNTGFNDPQLFDCVLDDYLYINDVSMDDIYNEIGPDGALPEQGLNNIRELYCSYYGVTDTTGIEKLPNLEMLNLEHNQLTSVDLSGNANLERLRLRYNYLQSIDLSNNRKIQYLDLAHNNLSQANLYYNTDLLALDVSDNRLSELNLSNSPLISAMAMDDISLITSARAKKDGENYTFHLPMPFYWGDASRWQPTDSTNYTYDTSSSDFIFANRNALTSGAGIESQGNNDEQIFIMASRDATEGSSSSSYVTIASRPVSIIPSLVVDGVSYNVSATSSSSMKYIGESWDSNDYREVVDQTLVENKKENVKLVKVEIYNSLVDTANVDAGLDSSSTGLHLYGIVPDIEVPMQNVFEATIPDDNLTERGETTLRNAVPAPQEETTDTEYLYNPDVILEPGTPDFRIIYYFETVDDTEVAVPDTGFSSRWEGTETTGTTSIVSIMAWAMLGIGVIAHIISCQLHKVRFEKH